MKGGQKVAVLLMKANFNDPFQFIITPGAATEYFANVYGPMAATEAEDAAPIIAKWLGEVL